MAQSMTIPEIKRLVQKVVWKATGAKLALSKIYIDRVSYYTTDDIAYIRFCTYSNIGAILYDIDWSSKTISIIHDRQDPCRGFIRFDGRY